MSTTRSIELNDLAPAELAELFCEMDSHGQTAFFEAVRDIAAKWPGAGWCQQSCSIADSITPGARFVIEKLAEHVLGYDETLDVLTQAQQWAEDERRWAATPDLAKWIARDDALTAALNRAAGA